jgi:hypothetical protein
VACCVVSVPLCLCFVFCLLCVFSDWPHTHNLSLSLSLSLSLADRCVFMHTPLFSSCDRFDPPKRPRTSSPAALAPLSSSSSLVVVRIYASRELCQVTLSLVIALLCRIYTVLSPIARARACSRAHTHTHTHTFSLFVSVFLFVYVSYQSLPSFLAMCHCAVHSLSLSLSLVISLACLSVWK